MAECSALRVVGATVYRLHERDGVYETTEDVVVSVGRVWITVALAGRNARFCKENGIAEMPGDIIFPTLIACEHYKERVALWTVFMGLVEKTLRYRVPPSHLSAQQIRELTRIVFKEVTP